MAILWAGTSTADCTTLGISSTSSNAALPAARSAHTQENIPSAQASKFASPKFAPASELWISGNVSWSTYSGAGGTYPLYELMAANGNNLFRVALPGRRYALQVFRGGSWVNLAIEPATSMLPGLFRFDIHVIFHATAGLVELYRDGALILSFSGDTSGDNGIITDRLNVGDTIDGVISSYTAHSGIIVATDDTRKYTFVQRLPNAAGAKQEWTGAYTDINEVGFNDTNFITTNTLGKVSTFGFADLPSEMAVRNVAALVIAGRSRNAGSISTVEGIARVGSTEYSASAKFDASPLYGPQNWVFNANPATGQAWLGSDIDAAEFGVKAA